MRNMQVQSIVLDMSLISKSKITTINSVVFYYNCTLSNITVIAAECYEVNTVFMSHLMYVANRQNHYRHATYGEKGGF